MDSLPQNDSHVKTNCQQDGVDRAFRSAFGDRAIPHGEWAARLQARLDALVEPACTYDGCAEPAITGHPDNHEPLCATHAGQAFDADSAVLTDWPDGWDLRRQIARACNRQRPAVLSNGWRFGPEGRALVVRDGKRSVRVGTINPDALMPDRDRWYVDRAISVKLTAFAAELSA